MTITIRPISTIGFEETNTIGWLIVSGLAWHRGRGPPGVARARRLNLDHVSAKIGQHRGGGRPGDPAGVSHLLHMTFVLGLCGSLCHPCFVKPAPPCESACSPSCRTLVLFLADM